MGGVRPVYGWRLPEVKEMAELAYTYIGVCAVCGGIVSINNEGQALHKCTAVAGMSTVDCIMSDSLGYGHVRVVTHALSQGKPRSRYDILKDG